MSSIGTALSYLVKYQENYCAPCVAILLNKFPSDNPQGFLIYIYDNDEIDDTGNNGHDLDNPQLLGIIDVLTMDMMLKIDQIFITLTFKKSKLQLDKILITRVLKV